MGRRSVSAVTRDPRTTVSSGNMKDLLKPRGREARPGRVNRTEQAWRSVPERNEDGEITGFHHFACKEPGCTAIVKVNEDGWAECKSCGRIYNDLFSEMEYYKLIGWSRFIKSQNCDTHKDPSKPRTSSEPSSHSDSNNQTSNDGPHLT